MLPNLFYLYRSVPGFNMTWKPVHRGMMILNGPACQAHGTAVPLVSGKVPRQKYNLIIINS